MFAKERWCDGCIAKSWVEWRLGCVSEEVIVVESSDNRAVRGMCQIASVFVEVKRFCLRERC